MHVGIATPQWRRKRSRHARRMSIPQFYVSGKRPMGLKVDGKCTFQVFSSPWYIWVNWQYLLRTATTHRLHILRVILKIPALRFETSTCFVDPLFQRRTYHLLTLTVWKMLTKMVFSETNIPVIWFDTLALPYTLSSWDGMETPACGKWIDSLQAHIQAWSGWLIINPYHFRMYNVSLLQQSFVRPLGSSEELRNLNMICQQ